MLILKSIRRMNPELEQALRENVYPINVRKNEIFQIPYARLEHLYFIEKGLMRYFVRIDGSESTTEFKKEDQFIIGLKGTDAYQSEGLGIEALEDSTLWVFPQNLVKDLFEKHRRFRSHIFEIKNRDFVDWDKSLPCRRSAGGTHNLLSIQKYFPNLLHRIPLPHLADFTNTPEKRLRHLLASPIKLHGAGEDRHRRKARGTTK